MRSTDSRRVLAEAESVVRFPHAAVEVLRVGGRGSRTARARGALEALKKERNLRFAGRGLCDRRSKRPVVYTENFFVQFTDAATAARRRKILSDHGLTVKRELEYAPNAYFVAAKEGTGQKIFDISASLLEEDLVALCHPELIREVRSRAAFPQQWHLKKTTINGKTVNAHANVQAAWMVSQGEGVTIALIDDGVDLDHEEFRGASKVVSPRDVTQGIDDARPVFDSDSHGTACAGVACANGQIGASGVAPLARLMPVRFASGLGSQAEAEAFVWAADHGADVISCSWGPQDGKWWDASDPVHNQVVPLPDSTRLAIDYAINNGRGGKGCVITWAAGNGNESVDNDGYASYEKVIAVTACSDRSKKSVYSDFGDAAWCAFPSSDFGPPEPLTPGIWTTDRTGAQGYNPNQGGGDAAGNYTEDFGGTSSACPGVAGVAALILSRNPDLHWNQVKELLKTSSDKIDTSGGGYDAEGHSPKYGYGRVNAAQALGASAPKAAAYTAVHTAIQTVPVKDNARSSCSVAVGDTKLVKDVRIGVNIEHTYVGDLIVQIKPPAAMGAGTLVLQRRQGGSTVNLKREYDLTSTPVLAALKSKSPEGVWTLEVEDRAAQDTGKILSFTVSLSL